MSKKIKVLLFPIALGGGYGEWEGEEEKLLQYRLGEAGLQLRIPGASSPLQVWVGMSLQGPQPPPPPPPKEALLSSVARRWGPPLQLPGSTVSVASKVYLRERLDPILQEKHCPSVRPA